MGSEPAGPAENPTDWSFDSEREAVPARLDMCCPAGVQSFADRVVRAPETEAGPAPWRTGSDMNSLLWVAQIILAGIFLFTGFSKIFAYGQVVKVVEARSKTGGIGMSRGQAALVGLVEIAG